MVDFETGNQRLLQLTDLLETVEEAHTIQVDGHEERRGYNQRIIVHECGSPACAWGHWFVANTERICKEHPRRYRCHISDITHKEVIWAGIELAEDEFGINTEERNELFESDGCGRADTGKEAADYIRQFVKLRERTSE